MFSYTTPQQPQCNESYFDPLEYDATNQWLYPYPLYYNQQQQPHDNNKPRLSTSIWDDERTICYQVDVQGICVARRQDNDMINGTKLLNVTGMSRGKRDGILKNEKGRVVVKVGAMHLKGVWVTFSRAKSLAIQYNILDQLYPLFVDDPSMYLYHYNYFPYPIYAPAPPSSPTSSTTTSAPTTPLPTAPSVPSMIPYNADLSPPPITVLSSNHHPYLRMK